MSPQTRGEGAVVAVQQLQNVADVQRALKKLGLTLETLETAGAAEATDQKLARRVLAAVKELGPEARQQLRAVTGAATSAPIAAAPSDAAQAASASQVKSRIPATKDGRAPRIDANVPSVAVLLQVYGAKKAPRPLERVLVHLAKLQDVLSSVPARADGTQDLDAVLDVVMGKDLRRHVFLLEGIAKIYAREHPECTFVLEKSKALEDALGLLSAKRSNLAYARQVDAAPDVLAHMEQDEAATRDALKKLLKEWTPARHSARIPMVAKIIDKLGSAQWADYVADKKFLRDELEDRLLRLAGTTHDMHDLQGGLHELRRQLRWFPIYAEAVNGLVQLDATKNPVPEYEPCLQLALASSKYVVLADDSREVDAIAVSKSLYTACIQLTLDLGSLKDVGEPLEDLMHAYVAVGKAKDLVAARAQVLALVGDPDAETRVAEKADVLYSDMKRLRLVEKLARDVRRG